MPIPLPGTVQESYAMHLVYDGVTATPGSGGFSGLEIQNLVGNYSGLGPSSPWCTPRTITPAAYSDTGTATATSSTTLTDSTKAWTTNQWAGRVVTCIVSGVASDMVVVSNTATVLTGAAWTNGTPGNQLYTVTPSQAPKRYDNWYAESQVDGNTNHL